MVKKDIEKLQPEVNIGLVGHVDHGKTTILERLSGKWTDTHSEELKRGITIKLGYADCTFYKCEKCKEFTSHPKCSCGGIAKPIRKVSFVDAPGHESLMATMLSGAAIIDGALLLIAANEPCPQPQTKEHLLALDIVGVKNIIIVQNKIDLVSEKEALNNYKEIKTFLKGTCAEKAPIIPISAINGINVNYLVEAIEKYILTPKRELSKNPIMYVARSFDVNRPGAKYESLVGGILGGVLKSGKLKEGEEIELRPGIKVEKEGRNFWKPIKAKIVGLKSGGLSLKEVQPGGSIGLLTSLDPAIVKTDNLTGNVAGHVGKLPPVWDELTLSIRLLERVVGSKKDLNVEPIKRGEILMLNVGSSATVGNVIELSKNDVSFRLKLPVCASFDDRFSVSRLIENRFRLIGVGCINDKKSKCSLDIESLNQ